MEINEDIKIKNAINFYTLANKLKYMTSDKKQSIADQVYGSMILAIAINSEYNKVVEERMGIVIRTILLGTMGDHLKDEMLDCLKNLNYGLQYAVDICCYRDSYRWKDQEGEFAFECVTIEHQMEYFFEEFLIEENIQTNDLEELYDIAKNHGITDTFGNDDKKNFEIFRFYYLNRFLKKKERSGWDSNHWNISNDRIERISEHVVGTVALALGLFSEFEFDIFGIDQSYILTTLCKHEVGEIKIGDITPFDNITKEQKQEIEHKAVIDVIGNLQQKEEMINSIFEFDERKTKETKFAYYCDKLEADIQAKIYQDMGCQQSLENPIDNAVFSNEKVKKMIENGATTVFDIWYQWDKDIYVDDPIFTKTLKYVKDTKLK